VGSEKNIYSSKKKLVIVRKKTYVDQDGLHINEKQENTSPKRMASGVLNSAESPGSRKLRRAGTKYPGALSSRLLEIGMSGSQKEGSKSPRAENRRIITDDEFLDFKEESRNLCRNPPSKTLSSKKQVQFNLGMKLEQDNILTSYQSR